MKTPRRKVTTALPFFLLFFPPSLYYLLLFFAFPCLASSHLSSPSSSWTIFFFFSFYFFFPFSFFFSSPLLDFLKVAWISLLELFYLLPQEKSVTSYSNGLPSLHSQPFQSLPTGQLAGLYSQYSSRSAGTSERVLSRGTEQLSHQPPGALRCCSRPLSRAFAGAAAIAAPAPQRHPARCPHCPNQSGWSLKSNRHTDQTIKQSYQPRELQVSAQINLK